MLQLQTIAVTKLNLCALLSRKIACLTNDAFWCTFDPKTNDKLLQTVLFGIECVVQHVLWLDGGLVLERITDAKDGIYVEGHSSSEWRAPGAVAEDGNECSAGLIPYLAALQQVRLAPPHQLCQH